MKFNKYCAPLLLLCAILANEVKQTHSGGAGTEMAMGAIPVVAGIVGMTVTGPLQPILVSACGIIHLAARILQQEGDSSGGSLSKNDFLEHHLQTVELMSKVDYHLYEVAENLNYGIEATQLLAQMRNDMDELQGSYTDNIYTISNPKITGKTKEASMHAMLDYFSEFRKTLRSFIPKYIKAKDGAATGEVNLFFDLMLKKDQIAADFGDDCHFESTHTKLFKSFTYILKVLTDAYVMVISAHTMQYQKELRTYNENEAIETKKIGIKLLSQYKTDMKILMDKAKWALDKASRDVRNCGQFEMKRGQTFEILQLAHILPKFKDWNFDQNERFSIYTGPKYSCYKREQDVKYNDFEIGECSNGDLGKPALLKAFVNPKSEWPYKLVQNVPTFGAKQELGRSKTEAGLIEREFFSTVTCYTEFCEAFKKNTVGISTQVVSADERYVITGLKLRMSNNIIYIDIQQGELLDDLTVDPVSVFWIEAQKSNEVIYLNSNVRKFELGDVLVNGTDYLRSIQLQCKNPAEGIIGLIVNGDTTSNSNPSGYPIASKSNEVVSSGSDNPMQFADKKNLLSKPPVPSKPYHVSLRPTDLKKDLGSATVPFLDIRPVNVFPPAPLGGCGFYYSTVKGSGGFIGLKLSEYNLNRFIDFNVIEQTVNSTQPIF